jgi:nucleoside phosphorylase
VHADDIADLILNYDPEAPQAKYTALLASPEIAATDRLPAAVPWPAGLAPIPQPLARPPADTESLEAVFGAGHFDAVVVTWTAAEAAALATLFTPGYLPSSWYEYRYDVATYIPLVTGPRAPFNSTDAEMSRYYHSLGLYFPCTIGTHNVLLFKSGLHLDYDGPATPVRQLMADLAIMVKPRVFITTGTAGAIDATVNGQTSDTVLGDVVVASETRFSCQQQFKNAPWLPSGPTPTSPVRPAALPLMTPDLLRVNAAKVPGARPVPQVWSDASAAIVTTDFFGFADTRNTYGLHGLGRACDMGDAMVGLSLTSQRL